MEGNMYAIIETGGKQYRVSPGQSVEVESLPGEIGDSLEIESVLLLANDGDVVVGKPTVPGAAVRATVTGQGRGGKVTVFKFRGGNRYQRKQGHRQDYTRLLIEDIVTSGAKKKRRPAEKKEPAPPAKEEVPAAADVGIGQLDLPSRVVSALEDAGFGGVQDVLKAEDEELLGVRGIGPKSVEQVRAALREKGFVQD
jgi:large subunit ribosomal protein L21